MIDIHQTFGHKHDVLEARGFYELTVSFLTKTAVFIIEDESGKISRILLHWITSFSCNLHFFFFCNNCCLLWNLSWNAGVSSSHCLILLWRNHTCITDQERSKGKSFIVHSSLNGCPLVVLSQIFAECDAVRMVMNWLDSCQRAFTGLRHILWGGVSTVITRCSANHILESLNTKQRCY